MTSTYSLAVAAPSVHTEVNSISQPGATSVTAANYAGGAAILVLLAVMITAGLSAAGMIKSHKSPGSAHSDTPHTAH